MSFTAVHQFYGRRPAFAFNAHALAFHQLQYGEEGRHQIGLIPFFYEKAFILNRRST